MKLFLIRHGQTDWNIEDRIQGSYDSELNSTGIVQAEELGRILLTNNYKFSKIYSSKQKRAIKTAQIISDAVDMDYVIMRGLEEVNLGEWEGLTWSEAQDKFPKEYADWYSNRRYTKSPNGESYQDVLVRVLEVLYKIINDNNKDVAIVTHGAVIRCLQCYLTNTDFNDMTKFKVDNTSITELDSEVLIRIHSSTI